MSEAPRCRRPDCKNEARYHDFMLDEGTWSPVPYFCGICDILINGGRGLLSGDPKVIQSSLEVSQAEARIYRRQRDAVWKLFEAARKSLSKFGRHDDTCPGKPRWYSWGERHPPGKCVCGFGEAVRSLYEEVQS